MYVRYSLFQPVFCERLQRTLIQVQSAFIKCLKSASAEHARGNMQDWKMFFRNILSYYFSPENSEICGYLLAL